MRKDTKDDMRYRAKNYIDKAIIPKIEEDLLVMVYALIGDKELEITHERGGYDVYPSCKDSLKNYCPAKKKRYQARLPEHALCWFGDSRIELYCRIISSIAGNKVYTPFSSIPQKSRVEEEKSDE
jgi:hypothetical protein